MPNDGWARTGARRRLLLLSNSRDAQGRFLVHARPALEEALSGVARAVFVPFAAVTVPLDAYAERAGDVFASIGVAVESLHRSPDPAATVRAADAIIVGGGNTFQLLRRLTDLGVLDALRERALSGVPYVGWSAGTVLACPTIQTTNDMPIVEPPRLTALGLVPFQINAHYTDAHPPEHQGETRAERIAEFLVLNPGVPVLGLREGSGLRVTGISMELVGETGGGARLFRHGRDATDYSAGADLSPLLEADPARETRSMTPTWR